MSGYKKHPDKDLYDVTFKTPDLFPIVGLNLNSAALNVDSFPQYKFAKSPETRRRAAIAAERRLANNVEILDEIVTIRRRLAEILKYHTWADFVTEEKVRISKMRFYLSERVYRW